MSQVGASSPSSRAESSGTGMLESNLSVAPKSSAVRRSRSAANIGVGTSTDAESGAATGSSAESWTAGATEAGVAGDGTSRAPGAQAVAMTTARTRVRDLANRFWLRDDNSNTDSAYLSRRKIVPEYAIGG